MIKAYRNIRRFRQGATFRPWLLKIVSNQALTMVRSRRRKKQAIDRISEPPPVPDVGDEVIDRERAQIIWQALASLKERERVVIYLRYFLALPERELAEYLDCPPGTVKSRLHRALGRLREALPADWQEARGHV